ncbi:MAG: hypothetical protein K8F91_00080 [Candidatus Obscuribacterales bacterium]|nr:hypothetical protein [Candidatus Obscuribacterales bacterium]
MCNQTAGLIARSLEESGISTVMISLLRQVTEKIKPPRVLEVPYGFGFPLGRPEDRPLQTKIIEACLNLVLYLDKSRISRDFSDSDES